MNPIESQQTLELQDIFGDEEFIRRYPYLRDMPVKLFLSLCTHRQKEAVTFFGKDHLVDILKTIQRNNPAVFQEYYYTKEKDPAFFEKFFEENLTLFDPGDFQEKSDAMIIEALETLQDRGLYQGEICRYQPDFYEESAPQPGTSPGDEANAEAFDMGDIEDMREPGEPGATGEEPPMSSSLIPHVVTYQEAYKMEEITILANKGETIICVIPIFSVWGNDVTHQTGEVPDPLGKSGFIHGYLPIEIVGVDHERQRLIFTPIQVESKEGFCFEGWAEKSSTGQAGWGTLSKHYVENFMHPVFYTLDTSKQPAKATRKKKRKAADGTLEQLLPSTETSKKIIIILVIAAILLLLLYLLTGDTSPVNFGSRSGSESSSGDENIQTVQEIEVGEKAIITGGQSGPGENVERPGTTAPQITPGPGTGTGSGTGEDIDIDANRGTGTETGDKTGNEQEKPVEIDMQTPVPSPMVTGRVEPTPQPSPREEIEIGTDTSSGSYAQKTRRQKPRFFYTDQANLYIQVHKGNTNYQLERALFLEKGELSRYNPVEKIKPLKLHTWIKVPLKRISPYTFHRIKRGETVSGLARRYGAPVYSIKVLNHVWSDTGLIPGTFALILKNR